MTSPPANPKTAVKPETELPQPRQFTFEEYCAYDDGTDNRYELVQGYLRLMTSPAGLHILICEFLVHIFNQVFAASQSPLCAAKDVGVRTGQNSSRIVDVCVNGEDRWQEIAQPGKVGIFLLAQTPLLVVEVTSSNEKEDYEAKYQEYAAIGIPEYWIVSRKREHVRVCTPSFLGGAYVYREFVKGERILSKVLPQLTLTVDEVLNPATVSQLIAQDQTRQAAAMEQVRQQATAEIEQAQQQAAESEQRAAASEQRAAELEAMLARYQMQFGNLENDALEGDV